MPRQGVDDPKLDPDTIRRRPASTGLDDILNGGLARGRLYLVEGVPGSGKTTLAMQFLIEGARRGEPVLYITLSETAEELKAWPQSHGWDLTRHHDPRAAAARKARSNPTSSTRCIHPSEVELAATTKLILEDVDRLKPTRVVFDSLSELRLVAGNPLRYRRQILALKQYLRRPQLHGACCSTT